MRLIQCLPQLQPCSPKVSFLPFIFLWSDVLAAARCVQCSDRALRGFWAWDSSQNQIRRMYGCVTKECSSGSSSSSTTTATTSVLRPLPLLLRLPSWPLRPLMFVLIIVGGRAYHRYHFQPPDQKSPGARLAWNSPPLFDWLPIPSQLLPVTQTVPRHDRAQP